MVATVNQSRGRSFLGVSDSLPNGECFIRFLTKPEICVANASCGCGRDPSLSKAQAQEFDSLPSVSRSCSNIISTNLEPAKQSSVAYVKLKITLWAKFAQPELRQPIPCGSGVQNEALAITDRGQHFKDAPSRPALRVCGTLSPLLCRRSIGVRNCLSFVVQNGSGLLSRHELNASSGCFGADHSSSGGSTNSAEATKTAHPERQQPNLRAAAACSQLPCIQAVPSCIFSFT